MDVRCARCGIEYEFDDALISERGTMVRCTECGHQFRVHPNHVIPAEPDEWRVVTANGRTLVFRTLRELQQGISRGEVGRDATLLRGRLSPRPLGSIAELDPFFPTRPGPARQQSTLTGVAPPPAAPPPGAKASSSTGKVPVARVGLSTVKLPANEASAEATYPVGQRKTALGIGSPALGSTLPLPEPAEPKAPSEDPAHPEPPMPVVEFDESAAVNARTTSEPPTLRDGEAPSQATPGAKLAPQADSQIADKKAMAPPRPARRTRPTPGAGTNAAIVNAAVSAAQASEPPKFHKPSTEPPPAQRSANAQTLLSEGTVSDPVEPMVPDSAASRPLHAVRPPPPQSNVDDALHFRAESRPIEAPSSPRVAVAPAAFDAGPNIPTVPPLRVTNIEALGRAAAGTRQGAHVGRWLMVGLLGVLVTLIAVWSHYRQPPSSPNESANGAAAFERQLQAARDALRAGDLTLAHENLLSSQALGTKDPRWKTLTARYDIVRADMSWLAVRLADPNDVARLDALKRESSENVAQSLKALSAVENIAASDSDIAAARLDAQRLTGDLDKARETAASLKAGNPSADLAYSLASIELLQKDPQFKEVFDWLGQARAQDSGLGRAPVMLVLACVAGNRMENARAEVQRLKLAARSHPLLAEIEAYVRRADQARATEQAALADGGLAAATDAGEAIADIAHDGDFRTRLRRAVESLGRNELTRAEQLFRSVLAEHPKDTEALTGLGDVARRHGSTANAIAYYERVLSGNGQYLPALSALADVKWNSGDRAGAAALYRRIVDQVGESASYGQIAAQHLREMKEGTSPKSNSPSASEKTTTESKTPAAPPGIDTTDLPGKSP
jgi:predicted Zn finger-like uncharacterized protein